MASRSAVVRIKDVQFRVEENDLIRVPPLEADVGAGVEFDEVLLVGGEEPRVGTPTVEGASVRAEVVSHGRSGKVVVFRLKRRKKYRRRTGHRQAFTAVRILSIEA